MAAIGDRAIPLVGDVGSQEDVTRMVGELVDAFGPVDVLVNNAALATYEATIRHFLEGDLDWWERIIRTNLTSVFLCSQAVAMSMARGAAARSSTCRAAAPPTRTARWRPTTRPRAGSRP